MSLRTDKAISLMKALNIPLKEARNCHVFGGDTDGSIYASNFCSINVEDLYDIFMDEDKLKLLITKLNNKSLL